MPLHKSNKIAESLKKQIKSREIELERTYTFEEFLKNPEWKRIEKEFKGRAEAIDRKLANFQTMPANDVIALNAERQTIIKMMSFKNFVDFRVNIQSKISELKDKLKKIEKWVE